MATGIALWFPLRQAWLCVECDTLSLEYQACPVCGGRNVWPLARWLNREKPLSLER